MPRTFVAATPAEIDRLRSLWDGLTCSGRYTLFQSFAWNRLASHVFAAREAPCVVAVEGASGAAILPGCATASGMSFLGEALFDYRDWLAAGDETATGIAWKELARRPISLNVTALRGDACDRWKGMGLPIRSFAAAPCVLCSDIDAVSFEARHHRGARLLRRLARLGVTPHQHSGRESALVRATYERKAAQRVDTGENLFADAARRDFLVAAAAQSPCDVFSLESAGTLVAAIVTFRDGNTRRFYTTYYDRAWAHYSPGIALLYEATRRSLAEGLDCDYMTGEQPHKLRFATSSVPLYTVHAGPATLSDIACGAKLIAA